MGNNLQENEYLLDRKIDCPICKKTFVSKFIKTGRARFLGTDEDLRPRYSGVDTVKYDVVMCPNCGYSAVEREFQNISDRQIQVIREEIASKFVGIELPDEPYSYAEAIRRYKMALLTAIKKPAKLSECAYLCLKLSWLYQGAIEQIQEGKTDGSHTESELRQIEVYENSANQYYKEAYKGFVEAISKEMPPICGMDENTMMYLMSVLCYHNEDYDTASRYAYDVISSRTVPVKLKEKQRDMMEKIKLAKEKATQN